MSLRGIRAVAFAALLVVSATTASAFVPVAPSSSSSSLRVSGWGVMDRKVASNTSVSATTTASKEAASTSTAATKTKSQSPIFEYLKFDGTPSFDVFAKTKEYVETVTAGQQLPESLFDEEYVLRGPVIGPINHADLAASQKGLGLREAYPDFRIDSFGYTIDPENPYRCFYFQRWRAVQEAPLDAYGDLYSDGIGIGEAEMPVGVFSVVWTPDEKIVYEQVGAVVDRFEGNTSGKAAVFGLLHHAGLKLEGSPGNPLFRILQRLGHAIGGRGRSWSREDEIPRWWASTSRGADETDQW